jgi:hypothetical protein
LQGASAETRHRHDAGGGGGRQKQAHARSWEHTQAGARGGRASARMGECAGS